MTNYVRYLKGYSLRTEIDLQKLETGVILFLLFMLIFITGIAVGFSVGIMR